MDEITTVREEYNLFPGIIQFDEKNPTIRGEFAPTDCMFYQTRDTLFDIDQFRNFLKNAESMFRASAYYKMYKSYLIEYLGINRCQVFGNVTVDDATIELHHNVIGLFDMCLLITWHTINTVGYITTYDLVEMLIQEHMQNNVGVVFLSKTAHQLYHHDNNGFIPPEMTFGKWWELLSKYRYGITYDLAYKIIKYIKKYQDNAALSVSPTLNDTVLGYACYNESSNYLPTDVRLYNDNEFNGGTEYEY